MQNSLKIICIQASSFKIVTVHAIQTDERVEVQLHSFLAVPLDEGDWSALFPPVALHPPTCQSKSRNTEQLPAVNK
jgi:hypothetical protein